MPAGTVTPLTVVGVVTTKNGLLALASGLDATGAIENLSATIAKLLVVVPAALASLDSPKPAT